MFIPAVGSLVIFAHRVGWMACALAIQPASIVLGSLNFHRHFDGLLSDRFVRSGRTPGDGIHFLFSNLFTIFIFSCQFRQSALAELFKFDTTGQFGEIIHDAELIGQFMGRNLIF